VHGKDYLVHDWETAVVTAAKAMALTVIDLLVDGAEAASRIKAAHQPKLTKQQYLDLMRGYFRTEEFEA